MKISAFQGTKIQFLKSTAVDIGHNCVELLIKGILISNMFSPVPQFFHGGFGATKKFLSEHDLIFITKIHLQKHFCRLQ